MCCVCLGEAAEQVISECIQHHLQANRPLELHPSSDSLMNVRPEREPPPNDSRRWTERGGAAREGEQGGGMRKCSRGDG